MTISEVIASVDSLKKGNRYSETEKIKWLSELDGIIKSETINTHEGADNVKFSGYDRNTKVDVTHLIVPEPYCDLYIHYLCAKMSLYDGEMERYNNETNLYNAAKIRFVDYWNRTHMPLGISKLRW